jgi:hypothetical protein
LGAPPDRSSSDDGADDASGTQEES